MRKQQMLSNRNYTRWSGRKHVNCSLHRITVDTRWEWPFWGLTIQWAQWLVSSMGEDRWEQWLAARVWGRQEAQGMQSGPCPDFRLTKSNLWSHPQAEWSHFLHIPREERVYSVPPPQAAEKRSGNIFQDRKRTNISGTPSPPPEQSYPLCSSDPAKKVSLILLNLSRCLSQVFREGLRWPSQLPLCFWGPRPQCSYHSLNLTWPCWNQLGFLSAGGSQSNHKAHWGQALKPHIQLTCIQTDQLWRPDPPTLALW